MTLQNQNLVLKERQIAMQEALKNNVHVFVINALLELQRLQLLNKLNSFTEASVGFAASLFGHYDAVIYSAVKLEEHEKNKIKKILEKKFGNKMGFEERVKPEILGGLIVEVGGWRFDDSLKEHASQLKQHLSA